MRLVLAVLLHMLAACASATANEKGMQITFSMGGGLAHFPGLSAPVSIKEDDLSASEASEVRKLLQDADFFALPAKHGAPRGGAADHRTYTITVEDGGKKHTVTVTDPVQDECMQRIIALLREKSRQARAAGQKPASP